jgi:predicted DNA binding protein
MYILTLDMKQFDCPFVNSSDDLEASYYMTYWDFQGRNLVTRGYIIAKDSEELQHSIELLQNQPKFQEIVVLSRERNISLVKTRIDMTDAMAAIRKNHGYIVGPFFVKNGRELWQVGFDTKHDLDNALYDLEKSNEFKITKQNELTIDSFSKVMNKLPQIVKLIEGLESLSEKERTIISTAIKYGFYDDPRKVNLSELSKKFGITKAGMSKRIRRIEKKINRSILHVLEDLD